VIRLLRSPLSNFSTADGLRIVARITSAEGIVMTTPKWQIEGQYYENCNCDYVCPCVPGQMQVKPTTGTCIFVMGFQIERGRYGDMALDDLGFVVVGVTPEEMAKGNWSVCLIIDERATDAQRDAITGIPSGMAGGPMAALSSSASSSAPNLRRSSSSATAHHGQ